MDIGKKITCDNCYWSWKIEANDKRKSLCHQCGYDNELNKFDIPALKKWKEENPNIKLPFKERKISEGVFLRTFDQEDSEEFRWHKDKEDRIIESIGETDWKFQMDNELPIAITGKIFIPKESYHRIIKGTGSLNIKLKKL
jgi:hypothetical protein